MSEAREKAKELLAHYIELASRGDDSWLKSMSCRLELVSIIDLIVGAAVEEALQSKNNVEENK